VLEAQAARIHAEDETYFQGDGVPAEKSVVDSLGREGRRVTFEMGLVPAATLDCFPQHEHAVICIYVMH
jgi:hypothetical protein